MKNIFFYLPAVLGIIFYGIILIIQGFSFDPLAIFCIIDLFICGFILSKKQAWGSLLGILVGIIYIYQSINGVPGLVDFELPTGIIICVYYLVCAYWVYKDK